MGKISLSEMDRKDLDNLANTGYMLLGLELEKSPDIQNYSSVYAQYSTIDERLRKIVQPANGYRFFPKGGKRAKNIENYIMQTILMVDEGAGMLPIPETPNISPSCDDNMGGLKAYIDDDNEKLDEKNNGVLFRRLQAAATILREQNRFDLIFNAMKYVREKYQLQE